MARYPSPRDFVNNWADSELSFASKVKAAVRNNLIKIRTGSSCCGNHGEPGC